MFDRLVAALPPAFHAARRRRPDRPGRQRALGGGDAVDREPTDQFPPTIVWLRHDPTRAALGYPLGASDSPALRALRRCRPVLDPAGRDAMRRPDPGRGRRTALPALPHDPPAVAVPVAPVERRGQRPKRRPRAYGSGEEKCHTLERRAAVDEESGRSADVAASVPRPRAALKVRKASRRLRRRPPWVGAPGDLAYVGILDLRPAPLAATPRREPRGQPRSAEGRRFDRAFGRRRIGVAHGIGRLRRLESLSPTDRHHRRGHTARVRAVAGPVNRMLDRPTAA